MTRTDIPKRSANETFPKPSSLYLPISAISNSRSTIQITNVTRDALKTNGTKIEEILSANAWIGGFEVWASSTSRTIWARAVSSPICVTSICREPSRLIVAPITFEPSSLCTGTDSPVSMDSSMVLVPTATIPSVGTFSPGFTSKISPRCTSAIGILRSSCRVVPSLLFFCLEKACFIDRHLCKFADGSRCTCFGVRFQVFTQ
mmetsp:Transcript_1416/g.1923  ORF Transcript_1416/g.1923 Transcript_1416/m.1923 type:complete len:203 (+) Transcript_1416:3726-4334(+)